MTERIECAVIGAGVVGLAIARKLAMEGHQILVFRSKFQQSTLRFQHFAAYGVVYHILKLSLMSQH